MSLGLDGIMFVRCFRCWGRNFGAALPGVEAHSGRPITAGALHLLAVRTNQNRALVQR